MMDKIEKLIQKLDEVWPGELGDDVDIKELQKDLKALKILMPLLQTMQVSTAQNNGYMIQIASGLTVDERSWESVKDFLLQNMNYQRTEAEIVTNTEKTVDNGENK